MNIIDKIFSLIQRIFNKKEIKMIEEAIPNNKDDKKARFIQSLKIKEFKKKGRVETLVCFGDGLGIQKKISY